MGISGVANEIILGSRLSQENRSQLGLCSYLDKLEAVVAVMKISGLCLSLAPVSLLFEHLQTSQSTDLCYLSLWARGI